MVQSRGLGADSAGIETNRSRRLGSDLGDTRKTLYRKLKKFWKNHNKSKKCRHQYSYITYSKAIT